MSLQSQDVVEAPPDGDAVAAHVAECDVSSAASSPDRRSIASRYWTLTASHVIVDIYPPFILALAVAIQANLTLRESQIAFLFAVGPVISGLSQPLLAWISDRFDTRIVGPLGLLVGAVALSAIGFAQSFWQLVALQVIGMAGTGAYHPIASALAGRMGSVALARDGSTRSARSYALSIFFAAGMIGGIIGPLVATRINDPAWLGLGGLRWLALMMIPGVVMAFVLHAATSGFSHKAGAAPARGRKRRRALIEDRALLLRWWTVALLFVANSLRFTVNIGLFYLFKRWAELRVADPAGASNLAGNLIAASAVGMAVTSLVVGRYVRPGRERGAMALCSFLTVPFICIMPWVEGWTMLAAAAIVSLGHFAVIPTSIGLAQRLLPHATSTTASILMGCGWAISAAAPFLGAWMIDRWSLAGSFYGFAALMGLSGVLCLLLSRSLLEQSANLD